MPNGDNHDGTEDRHNLTFKEVMEKAIQTQEMWKASVTDAEQLMALSGSIFSDIVPGILNSSDVPNKALPFVEQLRETKKHFDAMDDAFTEANIDRGGMPGMPNPKTLGALIKNLRESLDKLVEVSEINTSLESFSGTLHAGIEICIEMIENITGCAQETIELTSGLDDLFDDEEEAATDEQKPATKKEEVI